MRTHVPRVKPDGDYGAAMTGPLHGFKVVEACQMVAGPLAATICADLGAEVVKVEMPAGKDGSGGDALRGPAPHRSEEHTSELQSH